MSSHSQTVYFVIYIVTCRSVEMYIKYMGCLVPAWNFSFFYCGQLMVEACYIRLGQTVLGPLHTHGQLTFPQNETLLVYFGSL